MGKPSTYTKELRTFKACEKLPVTLGVSVDFPGYTALLPIYNGLVRIQPHNRESVQCTKIQFLFKERCMHVQCRHIILALNLWADRALYTTACPIATNFLGYGCRKDLITIHTFDLQSTWVIDMLFVDVYTTRQWQTSGRLVQELNVCTVLHKVPVL